MAAYGICVIAQHPQTLQFCTVHGASHICLRKNMLQITKTLKMQCNSLNLATSSVTDRNGNAPRTTVSSILSNQ